MGPDQPLRSDSPPELRVSVRPKRAGQAESDWRQLARWLYTNNPFYVISAWLVFVGLRSSFDTASETFQTGALMAGLAGYTLLLAVSACLLVRLGQVWDDVRSMLILVVLMFLALSVSFDDTLAANPRLGQWYFLGGLAFSIVVSEGLLWGMRLRLPVGFRVPYYLMSGLFFLYPLSLTPLVGQPHEAPLLWALFGFSSAAAVVLLTLLPAVRRGPEYVWDNGSPWRWPWYPWALFIILGLGVLARARYLCISFHFVGDSTNIFGFYFWIPFLLAANVILLEMGLVARHKGTIRVALLAPAVLVLLAVTGRGTMMTNLRFPERFADTLGATPLFLTLVALALFYTWCLWRRVALAGDALSISLALFCVCGPGTFGPRTAVLDDPAAWPLAAVAGVQLWMAFRRRNVVRVVVALGFGLGAAGLVLRQTPLLAYRGVVPFHILLGAVLLLGALVQDRFGRLLQYVGAVLIGGAGAAAVFCGPTVLGPKPPEWLQSLLGVYPALAMALAAAYGYLVGNRWYYLAAAGVVAAWLTKVGWLSYRALRQTVVGLDYLFWGMVFFLVALLISLSKAGAFRQPAGTERGEDTGG